MKPYYLLLAFSLVTASSFAQEEYKEPSKESLAYHSYRMWESFPTYGLSKVRGLIGKIKPEESKDGDGGTEKLSTATYNALSLREKFTYHAIHGESYSQNCDAEMPVQDEHKKIFGQLPHFFGENSWSERQQKFFITNRDSVLYWIKEGVTKDKRIGVNYKQILVDLNAVEMIPFLISTYNIAKKDHDILTLLMLLMKNGDYQPFMASASNKKLYSSDSYTNYLAFLSFNAANEELIIKRATDFYNGQPKK